MLETPKHLVKIFAHHLSQITRSTRSTLIESISLHRMRQDLRGILRLIKITMNTLQRQQLTFGLSTGLFSASFPDVNGHQCISGIVTVNAPVGKFGLKGLVHDNAHARRLSLQNKFVG